MRTSNPVFNSPTYQQAPTLNAMGMRGIEEAARPAVMTVRGTAIKTGVLVAITTIVAALTWNFYQQNPGSIMWTSLTAVFGGMIGGFIMLRKPNTAPFLAPMFAVAEGAFVAAISVAVVSYSSLAEKIGGDAMVVVGQAAGLTMAIALVMLMGYASGLLRLGSVAKKVIMVMTAGVAVYYLGAWLGNMVLGQGTIPRLGWSDSPIGIGFSVFVVVLASLNLVLDFQFVEEGAERQMPKQYEWIAAFGILTTLVWLYIELLRLLAKLRR